MCLAEALLRVPDSATANALIRDKIAGRHWAEGDDEDSPLVVALSARGLSLGSATLMLDAMGSGAKPLTLLKSMIRRSGEPVIRQARSEEHTSELQSLMRISYAVFCLKKKQQL